MSSKTKIPKLSILIATVGQRDERFLELLEVLMPQVNSFRGKIETVAYWNNGEEEIGGIRNDLVANAKGEYVSFIDDDDMVPEYYCEEIWGALLEKPDYVGWKMQLYHDGQRMKPTFHSIRYRSWSEDDSGYYRDVSHLNPIKRSIALQGSFGRSDDVADDFPWTRQVAPLVKTEAYIDKVMYEYRHSTHDSIWRGNVTPGRYHRPHVTYPNFRWHPKSNKES